VNLAGDPQQEFDNVYRMLTQLLDQFYPERSVTITSSDPPYVTPAVKHMLRKKNALMRSGQVEKAAALAVKIGIAIKNYNSAELTRTDMLTDASGVWEKVRQLTGRGKKNASNENPAITADTLNDHYAAISTDDSYIAPPVKSTTNNYETEPYITELRMFKILDQVRHSAAGLDNIPAWFLKTGAPLLAAPLADIVSLSICTSVVPKQWKQASIVPIPKIANPTAPSEYRPISITPVISRIVERIVVRDYIYPSLSLPPPGMSFDDQFAFQPTASTTAALIYLFHTITTLLDTDPFVIVYALDFSKAFDSVRHSSVLHKYSLLPLPDHIYNWIEAFFRDHSHVTRFGNKTSDCRKISASIIQGSGIGPASYIVTASDLHPVTPGNAMCKYADDTYLIVPASNAESCPAEIANVESWADNNNLKLNRVKSAEIVFVRPRSRVTVLIPPPAVPGFARVEFIKALGVTISRKFSISAHVTELLTNCARTMFALRTLKQHGLPPEAVHIVFQAIVMAKINYASPAWWGFTSADDRDRLEAFYRRCARFGYCNNNTTMASMCDEADKRLFSKIINNPSHLLFPLLPPIKSHCYNMRKRSHHHELPSRTYAIKDCNFLIRLLYDC